MTIDWTTAYDNRAAVANSAALIARTEAAAAAYRAAVSVERVVWGADRQAVDLVRPDGQARGLAVFIHGGYWHRNAPDVFTHLAAGALARGWAVALPGYRLCPVVGIADITRDVASGLEAVAAVISGPMRLAGHSAGGHLASRMVCGALSAEVLERVTGLVSISGLHDLRPITRTPLQDVLSLTQAEAVAESPALLEPLADIPVTAWVGAEELPELRRQSRLLAEIWGGFGLDTRVVEDTGLDHFTVIEALSDPDAPITAAWIGET